MQSDSGERLQYLRVDGDNEKRERRYKGWKKAVKRSLEWAKEDEE
ncbi:hypothetical protein [Haemophilus haemolyticus]|nr:hypothetical protein [Haemophilus haemolyticus]